jgi:hypothetical protein
MENQDLTVAHLFANPLFLLFFWLLVFGISGGVASVVAPQPRRLEFFILTFFFLGPLGVGFAAIAPSRPPNVDNALIFACKTCGVAQNVPHSVDDPVCYSCKSQFHFAR